MSAHIAGPWEAVLDDRGREECAWIIEERSTPCNFVVATVVTDISMLSNKGEATARLIASAPDLLEAAAELEGWISRVLVHTYTNRKPMPENLEVALEKIRAAIAKASGAA